MKHIPTILLFLSIIAGTIGFIIKDSDSKNGEFLIGMSIAVTVFLTMPIFIYNRWKKRSVKDYMLTKENIEKMRNYSNDKKL